MTPGCSSDGWRVSLEDTPETSTEQRLRHCPGSVDSVAREGGSLCLSGEGGTMTPTRGTGWGVASELESLPPWLTSLELVDNFSKE